MGRWQYVKETMFGPHCGGTECLYTLATAVFTGGVGYSLTGYVSVRFVRKDGEQEAQGT
jgi:hypothetical protein